MVVERPVTSQFYIGLGMAEFVYNFSHKIAYIAKDRKINKSEKFSEPLEALIITLFVNYTAREYFQWALTWYQFGILACGKILHTQRCNYFVRAHRAFFVNLIRQYHYG